MAVIRIEVPSDNIDLIIHVDDQLVYQPVSEFNTGIRQGNASNDDRNLASFFSFEDARAGIGTRVGDVREDVDKLGDQDGVITLQFNQMIKSPEITSALNSDAESKTYQMKSFESDYAGSGLEMYVVTNSSVASILNSRATDGSGSDTLRGGWGVFPIRDAIVYISPVDGDEFLVIGTEGATNAEYGKNTADASVSTGKVLQSFIEFDGKLFAAGAGELWWTIDLEDEWIELAGNWPREWQFLGVFPFGQTYMPYVLTNPYDTKYSQIAVVNTDNGTLIPLRLGIGSIDAAVGIRSEIGIIAEAGREVFMYEPFNRTIRDLDWRAVERNGFDSVARDALARDLVEHRRGLVVVAELQTTDKSTQLFMHTGTGWHPYGAARTDVHAGSNDQVPMPNATAYSTDAQVFWVLMHNDTGASTTWRSVTLPWFDEPFTPNINQTHPFEDGNQTATMPWFNMGFSDLPGIALAMRCGGWFDATHTIKIEYQIDFVETSWTTLGTFPGAVPADPEITNRVTPVAGADTLTFGTGLHGVAFKWIRFRITLATPASSKKSPNAYPLTFQFIKRPNLRDQVRFAVDWQRTQAANPDLPNFTIKDLVNTIRDIYNATTQPKITINGEVTYSVITSYPRVPVLGPSIHRVTGDVDYESAVLVLTAAELL
jgi:hypothetical protein